MATFEAQCSIHMSIFHFWLSYHFVIRYSKFYIWPWKFKVKVMAKVKPFDHNLGLNFIWYFFVLWQFHLIFFRFVAITPNFIWQSDQISFDIFSFCGNQTILAWDIANSIHDLENSRSRSWSISKLIGHISGQEFNQYAFCFVAIGPFLAEI